MNQNSGIIKLSTQGDKVTGQIDVENILFTATENGTAEITDRSA